MKEFRLERITYEQAEEYARSEALVLLPVSPLEAHGPHLPLCVDFLGAAKLSELSARILNEKGVPAVVAPILPYALSEVAMPFTGTVSLKSETLKALITDIATSFKHHKFKGMVVVCQHLEPQNLNALQEASLELSDAGIPTITVNPFARHADTMIQMMTCEFPQFDLHAGEWETAFCLWACPELVKKEMLKHMPPNWVDVGKKFIQDGCKDFLEAGGLQCYFGDPSCATPELGEKLYETLASAITTEIDEWLAGQ